MCSADYSVEGLTCLPAVLRAKSKEESRIPAGWDGGGLGSFVETLPPAGPGSLWWSSAGLSQEPAARHCRLGPRLHASSQ